MNKRVYNALNKVAASYTPEQWRKYTTAEEREALARAEKKLPSAIKPSLLSTLYGSPGSIPVGWLVAGLTPSYTTEDMLALANDKNFKNKAYIPGYFAYKNMKMLGYQQALSRRVKEAALKELEKKDKKRNTDE